MTVPSTIEQESRPEMAEEHHVLPEADQASSVPLNENEENQSSHEGSDNCSDEEDDDMTVVVLENRADDNAAASLFSEQDSPEMEERRRQVLLRELQRVQRASFIHFLILCLIPTSLLFIVIATVLGEDDVCESTATLCEQEERTFINAFTTRCVCNAIPVAIEETP